MPLFTAEQPFFIKKTAEDNLNKNPTASELALVEGLFDSAKNGDLATIQQALKSKLPWDVTDANNYTLLTTAAFYGQREIVEALLEYGFNPAYLPKPKPGIFYSYNAFHAACAGSKGGVAILLLNEYANLINMDMVEPFFEQSGLQIAIRHRNFEFTHALMNQPLAPNLSHSDKRRRTALATALGSFVHDDFEAGIVNTGKLLMLELLCLRLLANENAFDPPKPARPAIQLLFNTEFAYNYPSRQFPGDRPESKDVMINIMLNAPFLTETLHKQALEKNALPYAQEFLQLYSECEFSPKISRETRSRLHRTFVQLG